MPDEVVVVDNNSTDKTIKIVEKYKFVKLIYEKRQGIAFARNSGFDAATSAIVGRIDADTIIASDWVWQTKEYFNSNPSVCAVTGSCYFYDFPFKRGFHALHSFVYYELQRFIARTHILWGSNMAIRKVNWRNVKPICNTVNGIHEDIDLTLCLHRQKQIIGRNSKMNLLPDLMSTFLGFGSSLNGTITFNTPLSKLASTLLPSAWRGSTMRR
jgi:glycosyltransferase involved in cell wall biosynthesis